MRVLYKVTGALQFDKVTKDILENWYPPDKNGVCNLFSVTQIASRTGISRQSVRRRIRNLIKMGIVEKHGFKS